MTIRKIGGTTRRMKAILATEIIIVLASSIIFALILTVVVSRIGMEIVGSWLS
jgi:hypothetical protein